jgi:hypothetical protein
MRFLLPLALLSILNGCAGLGYRDAMPQLAGFARLADSPQVRFSPGAESYAQRVAAILASAIAKVEAGHYRPFDSPPEIYICESDACFHRFVASSYNFTAAVVYNNRLVLAARLFDREPQRLEPILVHELSHLHLGQRRGHYTTAIPIWFHEGLAALVADGGGADLSSDTDAWEAADSGNHFLPDEQHLPWVRKRAENWGISIHVFYRQAFIYLRDLRSRNGAAFAQLLDRLYDGEAFDAAFAASMHTNPARSGLAFFQRLHCAEHTQDTASCSLGQAPK